MENHFFLKRIEVSNKANFFELFVFRLMFLGNGNIKRYKDFIRKARAVNLPPTSTFHDSVSLPKIELTVDCIEKDLPLLKYVISATILNSLNPIEKVSVVVPKRIELEVHRQLYGEDFYNLVTVIPENEIICDQLNEQIRAIFPNNTGWILHQFLTLQQILNSYNGKVLSVDADTLVVRPFACVSKDGKQILMESLEYNDAYYEFLYRAFPQLKSVERSSHVTHYSFFQRDILLEIMRELGIMDVHMLFDLVCKFADLSHPVPICIDRELYAYGILHYYPNTVEKVKFSNLTVNLGHSDKDLTSTLELFGEKFNSVSAHSYLQSTV